MRALGLAGGIAIAGLAPAAAAQADQTFTVTTTADSGIGSLRDAIASANASPGNNTIVFESGLTGTIALTSDLPKLTTQLTIDGPGARELAIDAAGIAAPTRPTLEDSNYAANGGVGSLSIDGLTLEHSKTGSVYNFGEALTLDHVTVIGDGVDPSLHTRVEAVEGGGATTIIEHSTITGTIGNSGAALYTYGGNLVVRDSTITGNHQAGYGGMGSFDATTTVDDSTITDDTGGGFAGGINQLSGGTLSLHDSVVAGNTTTPSTGEPDIGLTGGATATVGFSLLGRNPATPVGGLTLDAESQALAGRDPMLGPLQNNGGQTDTQRPLAGSPLIDQGKTSAAPALTDDQRGLSRLVMNPGTTLPGSGDGTDIGAVEVRAAGVSGVAPAMGRAAGTVIITGTGFTDATAVSFGGTPATSFTVSDDGHLEATVPAGTGTVDVRVSTPGGPSPIAGADHFTYASAASPPPVRPAIAGLSAHSGSSGQTLRITGSHFTSASTVRFGSTRARFTLVSDGSITATVPSGHGREDVSVTGPGGTSLTGAADRFSYLSASVGHHAASAKWKNSSVVVDSGVFAGCPRGGDRCSVSFKAVSSVPAFLAAVRKVKTKTLTVGSGGFHVSAGKRGEVTFTLTRKGLRALERLGKLKLVVEVTVIDGSVTTKQTRTITTRLPRQSRTRRP